MLALRESNRIYYIYIWPQFKMHFPRDFDNFYWEKAWGTHMRMVGSGRLYRCGRPDQGSRAHCFCLNGWQWLEQFTVMADGPPVRRQVGLRCIFSLISYSFLWPCLLSLKQKPLHLVCFKPVVFHSGPSGKEAEVHSAEGVGSRKCLRLGEKRWVLFAHVNRPVCESDSNLLSVVYFGQY